MIARVVYFLALFSFAQPTADDSASKKDLAAFQGEWQLQWVERDGVKIDAMTRLQATGIPFPIYTIRGKTWCHGEKAICAFELDASADPKLIDFVPEKEARSEGIYKVGSETMTWCLNTNTGGIPQRPSEFRAAKASGLIVYSFTRVK